MLNRNNVDIKIEKGKLKIFNHVDAFIESIKRNRKTLDTAFKNEDINLTHELENGTIIVTSDFYKSNKEWREMRISEKKSLQLNSFNNIIIEVCWMEGLIEVKTKKNLNLFYETITNNKDLINSVLKKIDCSLLNRGVLVLKEIKMNFFKTKVLLEFNASFLNDDPIVKMIELILKIDVEKDTEMIAEILLNNGKENFIYNEVKWS